MSGARWPARYEVRVEGVLDGRWSQWFQGLRIDNQETEDETHPRPTAETQPGPSVAGGTHG